MRDRRAAGGHRAAAEADHRGSAARGVAAELLKIEQPKILAPVRGRLAGFSLGLLVRFVLLLEREMEIVVSHARPHLVAQGSW